MTISDFKKQYASHNPCENGAELFEKCRTVKEVYELALSPEGGEFLMRSIKEGWGPSPEDLRRAFKPHINGKHTVVHNFSGRKVRSQMWCNANGVDIDEQVRIVLLCGCRGEVRVDDWQVVKILVDRNSTVDLKYSENSVVFVDNYGGSVWDSSGKCKIKNY